MDASWVLVRRSWRVWSGELRVNQWRKTEAEALPVKMGTEILQWRYLLLRNIDSLNRARSPGYILRERVDTPVESEP